LRNKNLLLLLIPYKWDESAQCFCVNETLSIQQQWRSCSGIYFIIFFVTVSHFCYSVFSGSESQSFLLLNTVFAAIHASGLIMIKGNFGNAREFCQLFNCINSFGANWKIPGIIPIKHSLSLTIVMTLVVCIVMVIVFPGISMVTLLLPCHQFSSILIKNLKGSYTCSHLGYQDFLWERQLWF